MPRREHRSGRALAPAAQEAAAGEGGLVLISGEAGIGKSSLVRALRGLLPGGEVNSMGGQISLRARE